MADKKQILLQVKTDMGNSDKEISRLVEQLNGLNRQVYELQIAQKSLKGQIKASEQVIQTYNQNITAGRQNGPRNRHVPMSRRRPRCQICNVS